jgi:hypothetical protein
MNWTIEFGGTPEDVVVTTHGVATREGFVGFNTDLVSDPRWRAGMSVLLDHSDLDATQLTGEDVEGIAEFISTELAARLGPVTTAIVFPDPYGRGVAAVSVQMLLSPQSTMRIRSFPSRELARDWLRAQKPEA